MPQRTEIRTGIPTVKIVNASVSPQVIDEQEELEKQRKWVESLKPKKLLVTQLGKANDELSPNYEERLKIEHRIPYREEKCQFCSADILYREADEIYSPMRGVNKSVIKDGSFPIHIPISPTQKKNRWDNYEDEITGATEIHTCQLEKLSQADLLRYIANMNREHILFQQKMQNELRLLRKTTVQKPFYVDRD